MTLNRHHAAYVNFNSFIHNPKLTVLLNLLFFVFRCFALDRVESQQPTSRTLERTLEPRASWGESRLLEERNKVQSSHRDRIIEASNRRACWPWSGNRQLGFEPTTRRPEAEAGNRRLMILNVPMQDLAAPLLYYGIIRFCVI